LFKSFFGRIVVVTVNFTIKRLSVRFVRVDIQSDRGYPAE
jgi:hypothetical protein